MVVMRSDSHADSAMVASGNASRIWSEPALAKVYRSSEWRARSASKVMVGHGDSPAGLWADAVDREGIVHQRSIERMLEPSHSALMIPICSSVLSVGQKGRLTAARSFL